MEQGKGSDSWVKSIFAVTLFQEDLSAAEKFYQTAFELEAVYEDANSYVFKFGETMINLLDARQTDEQLAPAKMSRPDAGARSVYTVHVEDVDALCAKIQACGVTLINGPFDRPWGIRKASFADPGGNVWEIAK